MASFYYVTRFFIIYYTILQFRSCTSKTLPNEILSLDISSMIRTDSETTLSASTDYGNLIHEIPLAVFYPSSVDDIISLIKFSTNLSTPFSIAPKGCGHSVRGQAMTSDGVVVEMSSLSKKRNGIRVSWDHSIGHFADVGGEQLWSDVLKTTLENGLAPVSWTDYLYLSVGGTLSNAGISGQSFLHGPQISNVHELDVITGKGEFITCSKHMNSELFFAVLGGLGQFGIITRARIVLHTAPTRAKWVRLVYSDFGTFTRDQEHLISIDDDAPNYLEGSIITEQSPVNNWRSNSFYTASDQSKINALLRNKHGILYAIELVKYYDDTTADTIDQKLEDLLEELNIIPGFIFKRDVPLIDFLNRVGNRGVINQNSIGKMEAHPWLNMFIPKSQIMDFNRGVFQDRIRYHNRTSGPVLFYPLNRTKWDIRMSSVIPDEEIFYTMALLHTSGPGEIEILDKLCNEIMEYCEKAGINIKQYIPHYKTKEDWVKHYGSKWNIIQQRKAMFDPRMILSPGQRIFNSV